MVKKGAKRLAPAKVFLQSLLRVPPAFDLLILLPGVLFDLHKLLLKLGLQGMHEHREAFRTADLKFFGTADLNSFDLCWKKIEETTPTLTNFRVL